MSNHKNYDYSGFDHNWAYRGSPLSEEQRKELICIINPAVCKEHNILAIEHHKKLLFELVRIMKTGSDIPTENGKISPPKDQPSIKIARKKIKQVAQKLSEFHELIHEFVDDQTVAALINRVGGYEHTGELLLRLGELTSILEQAANYLGQKGARRNPDWIKHFCERCSEFWGQHMSGGKSLVYQHEQESPVSEWTYHLFKELGEFTEMNPKDSLLYTQAKNPNR